MTELPCQLRQVFGVSGSVRGGCIAPDPDTLLYVAGCHLVLLNLDDNSQSLLPLTRSNDTATALAMSHDRRYVAVALTGERASIGLFFLPQNDRIRTLTIPEVIARQITTLHFSPCGMYLLALTSAPEYAVCLFSREKSTPLAVLRNLISSKAAVSDVFFAPSSILRFSVVGGSGAHFTFEAPDTSSPPECLPARYSGTAEETILTGLFLDEGLQLLVSNRGELLYVRAGNVVSTFDLKPHLGQQRQAAAAVGTAIEFSHCCLHLLGADFIVALPTGTILRFNNRIPTAPIAEPDHFRLVGIGLCLLATGEMVTSITTIPESETSHLVVMTSMGQVVSVQLKMPESETNIPKSTPFLPISHSHRVLDASICPRRGLLATIADDRRLIIWNLLTREQLYVEELTEQPFSLSMHPTGHFIVIAFSDQLRVIELLLNSTRTLFEIPAKKISLVRYSNGGQYIAAVHQNAIKIFDSILMRKRIDDLRHHGRVAALEWSADDACLYSTSVDGSIFMWRSNDGKELTTDSSKVCHYQALTRGRESDDAIYLATSDGHVKHINSTTLSLAADCTVISRLTDLAAAESILVGGMDSGSLHLLPIPLPTTDQGRTIAIHNGPVIRLFFSRQLNILVSVSADGTIGLLEVAGRSITTSLDALPDEILLTSEELQEMKEQISDLQRKIDNRRTASSYELKSLRSKEEAEVNAITEKLEAEIAAITKKTVSVLRDAADSRAKWEQRLVDFEEDQQMSLERLRNSFDELCTQSAKRYEELTAEIRQQQSEFQREEARLIAGHEKTMRDMRDDYELQLREDLVIQESFKGEAEIEDRAYQEALRQMDEDYSLEYEQVRKQEDEKLSERKERLSELKAEASMLEKRRAISTSTLQSQDVDIQNLNSVATRLEEELQEAISDNKQLEEQVHEFNTLVQAKETKIHELKRRNQTLEKHKYVLDYRIRNLKKEIDPKIQEIEAMKAEVAAVNRALEMRSASNYELVCELQSLEQRTRELQSQIAMMNHKQRLLERQRGFLDTKLWEARRFIYSQPEKYRQIEQQIAEARRKLECDADPRVAERYAMEEEMASVMQEEERHAAHLRAEIDRVRKQSAEKEALYKAENSELVNANITLIQEIKGLRSQMEHLAQRHRALTLGAKSSGLTHVLKRQFKTVDLSELEPDVSAQLETEIEATKLRIGELEAQLTDRRQMTPYTGLVFGRPISREQLPPLAKTHGH